MFNLQYINGQQWKLKVYNKFSVLIAVINFYFDKVNLQSSIKT